MGERICADRSPGPRLIVPNDVRGGRYVSCVREIRLASTDDSDGIGEAAPVPQAAPGAPGAAGTPGAAGAPGTAGRDAVSCAMKGSTVRCSALLVSSKAKARLTRLGRTVANGTLRRLVARTRLERGEHYTLRLGGGGSARIMLN